MFKAMVSSLFCLFLSNQAFAGFMFEPYLGYESSKLAATAVTSGTDQGGTGTAISLGARVGWGFGMGFWAALDYMMDMSGKSSPTQTFAGDITYTRTDLGLSLGYNFPIKLRTYLTYNLTPSTKITATPTGSTGSDTTYTGGTSWKLGVGYSLIAWLTANFEYYSNAPAKFDSAGTTGDVSTVYSTYAETGYRLVFSFPLHL